MSIKIVENKKAPGRQLVKQMSLRTKWILLSIFSMMLSSYGIIVLVRAAWLQASGEIFTRWFLLGVYALILMITGFIMYGNALRIRTRMDTRREMRRFIRKNRRLFAKPKSLLEKKKAHRLKQQSALKDKQAKESPKENPAKHS